MPKITVGDGPSYAVPHPRPGEGEFFKHPETGVLPDQTEDVDDEGERHDADRPDEVDEAEQEETPVDGDRKQVGGKQEDKDAAVPKGDESGPATGNSEAQSQGHALGEVKATAKGTVTKGPTSSKKATGSRG